MLFDIVDEDVIIAAPALNVIEEDEFILTSSVFFIDVS